MKLKVALLILLVIAVSLSAVALSACKPRALKIDSIEVVGTTLKEFYALDEQIDYENAKIKVYYSDGTSQIINITESMVTGFNSSITSENAIMVITYEKVSVNFSYSVTYSVPVQTAFRIQMVKKEIDGRKTTVSVRATGLSKSGPVYAVRMIVQSTSDVTINSVSLKQSGFTLTQQWTGYTQVSLIIFSNDGELAIEEDSIILEIEATRASKTGTLYIQSIAVSDGENDFAVPAANSLDIGETAS